MSRVHMYVEHRAGPGGLACEVRAAAACSLPASPKRARRTILTPRGRKSTVTFMHKSIAILGVGAAVLFGAGCGSDDSSGSGGAGGAGGATGGSGGASGGSGGATGGSAGAATGGSSGAATGGSGGAAGSATGGAGGAAGGSGNKCQECVACVQGACATEITECQKDAACGAIYTCTSACGAKTADQCIADNPSGLTKWATVSACLNKNCLPKCQ